jgi:hypothetical protein
MNTPEDQRGFSPGYAHRRRGIFHASSPWQDMIVQTYGIIGIKISVSSPKDSSTDNMPPGQSLFSN